MRRFSAILVVAFGAFGACAPHAEPKPFRAASFDETELVSYRSLARDDFRGSTAAGFVLPEDEKIPAMTCTKIVVRPGDVVTRADGGGYVASLDSPIFFSVMSRKCSWWSAGDDLPDEQVLEHAQIHFAIDELEARRLNSRVDELVLRIRTAGSDLGSVSQRAQGELRTVLEAANQSSLERSKVFDMQVARDRVRQRAWLHKIVAELEATQAYARGPQTSSLSPVVLGPAPPPPGPTAVAPAPTPPPTPVAAPAPPAAGPLPAPSPPPVSSPSSSGSFPD